MKELASELLPKSKRRKTTLHTYSSERRASIGKYVSLHGPTAAVKHFTKICDHTIPESTARKFRDAYLKALKASSTASSSHVSVASLPC